MMGSSRGPSWRVPSTRKNRLIIWQYRLRACLGWRRSRAAPAGRTRRSRSWLSTRAETPESEGLWMLPCRRRSHVVIGRGSCARLRHQLVGCLLCLVILLPIAVSGCASDGDQDSSATWIGILWVEGRGEDVGSYGVDLQSTRVRVVLEWEGSEAQGQRAVFRLVEMDDDGGHVQLKLQSAADGSSTSGWRWRAVWESEGSIGSGRYRLRYRVGGQRWGFTVLTCPCPSPSVAPSHPPTAARPTDADLHAQDD